MSKTTSKAFWEKIRFKYKISFLNENTLEEVFSLRLSRLTSLIALFLFAVFIITLTSFVIIKTPIRNYLPGYLDADVREKIIKNALTAESLESELAVRSLYLDNVSAILRGDIKVEEAAVIDSVRSARDINLEKSEQVSKFVENYEEEEKYNLSGFSPIAVGGEKPMFYTPVKGIVSSTFDRKEKHYGIDIASTLHAPVMATMKGMVIYTGFDPNAGYVIQIQHLNGFVSVYKHNAKLLKSQGDAVGAGEAIALAGNTGNLSTGIHLHFELWLNGKPVNPGEYINFD
ncbi:MAG: M23 family metallopeptidase [Dysgonamonadaceae bacterium]|jgi:murein DD-endopeptidase MepM/ murein hydrolase activator NlpD|nr:M23 family metallopeptidase [Dysgonamonadaceae bacterium]